MYLSSFHRWNRSAVVESFLRHFFDSEYLIGLFEVNSLSKPLVDFFSRNHVTGYPLNFLLKISRALTGRKLHLIEVYGVPSSF